jgi:4-amino-4-deoxy-L-arabinose transferase-like glycosyltransferase
MLEAGTRRVEPERVVRRLIDTHITELAHAVSRPALLRRLALAAIAALAGLLYAWALGQGTLEYYYAAAVRSMSMSWHNFIFGAFDPAGTITLDKLPGAFWVQALSVRAFGFHPWAIVLPQAVEGILTVLVLYHAVSRLAGSAAGLIAALILAVSPATVALDRGNISDSLLILLLVLAADAVSGAITAGAGNSRTLGEGIGGLVLAAVWVGLAFQTKMIQAWMVLPALGLAYLLSGPGTVGRRTAQLAVAGTLTALVSLSWMIAVSLVPAADRPYVDGSHDDSIFEQVFVYNGFGRFGDQNPQQLLAALARSGSPQASESEPVTVEGPLPPGATLDPAAPSAGATPVPGPAGTTPGSAPVSSGATPAPAPPSAAPAPGATTITRIEYAPSARPSAGTGSTTLAAAPPAVPNRLLRGDLGRDTGWLIPAAGVIALWGIASRRRQPRGDPLRACFILWGGWLVTLFAVFSAITVINAYYTAALSPAVAAIIGAGVAAAWSQEGMSVGRGIGIELIVVGTVAYAAWLVSASGGQAPGWLVPAVIAVGVVAVCVTAWALVAEAGAWFAAALAAGLIAVLLAPAVAAASVTVSRHGAFDTPFESAAIAQAVARAGQTPALINLDITGWQTRQDGAPDLMAAQTVALPSLVIYDRGIEALPIGGVDGTTPSPTLGQLQADIRRGTFHLVWILADTDPRMQWIASHCTQLSRRFYLCEPADAG